MRVKVAHRGPSPGSEFWGCNAYRTRGCRGTREVPRQEWDWFGLVRVPVSILRNAQNSHRKDLEEFLEYDAAGMFGSYADYDDDMAYFEEAMEAENRRWGDIEAEEIYQVLSRRDLGHSLARRIVETSRTYGLFGQAREAVAIAITGNFAGSASTEFVSMSAEYPGQQKLGIVYLDDGSDLRFNCTSTGIQMLVFEDGLESVMLHDSDFKYIAEHFVQNFGSHAPSSIRYL